MALPKQVAPTYDLIIPSTGAEFQYRPFLVKEQKALLLAQQSENPTTMANTLRDVISACSKEKIDVDKLATFDVEYIFSQLRAKSVGEMVELYFFCDECTEEESKILIKLDLSKLEVTKPEGHNKKIPLFEDVGIMMKYPSMKVIKLLDNLRNNEGGSDIETDIIIECIDYIFDSEEVFRSEDQSKEELLEFINNLTAPQFEELDKFFQTMPKLQCVVDYNCPACNKEHHKVLEGLESFFY